MRRDDLRKLALEIVEEIKRMGPLALGGASVHDEPHVATDCSCDMLCGCNAKCGCNTKEGCGCNERCPCNARQIPMQSDWLIDPDPQASRVHLTLDASGSAESIVKALKNVRAGLKALKSDEVDSQPDS
jgi:hypothetical protein